MIENKSFNVIPIDKNTYIFVGEPATGKSFLAYRVGAISLDINVFDTTVIDRFQAEVKTANNRRMIHPIVIYITNSKSTAEQLELYLKYKL